MKPSPLILFGLLLGPFLAQAADAPATSAASAPAAVSSAAPAGTARATAAIVKGFETTGVDLYRSKEETAKRASNDDLAAYTKRLQAACEEFFANATVAENLAIVAAIKPGPESRVWLVSSREPLEERLNPLHDKLAAIPPPPVNVGPVAFCIYGRVNGGWGKELKGPTNYPPLPQAWKDVLAQSKDGAPVLFDEMLLAAWSGPSRALPLNWATLVAMAALILSAVCAMLAFMRRNQ